MLKKIQISNFKAIKDKEIPEEEYNPENIEHYKDGDKHYKKQTLTLDDLAPINYLVGPNGCGKSSVLEGVYLKLKDTSDKDYIVIHKGPIEKEKSCIPDYLFELSQTFSKSVFSLTSCTKIKFIFLTRNTNFITKYIRDNIISSLKKDKTFIVDNSFTEDARDLVQIYNYIDFDFIYSTYKYKLKNLSQGQAFKEILNIVLNEFSNDSPNTQLFAYTIGLEKNKKSGEEKIIKIGGSYNLVLIDEPETYLHPDFQKLIPRIISDIRKKDLEIQFLISTHSPFIISAAAKEENQKVYLIEGGQTKDVDTGELNTERSQKGYSGGECLLAVNEMLGSNINDIAPHTIIFCERTLKILLEKLFEKPGSKPTKPIILTDKSGGGDDRICKGAKLWKEIFLNTKNALETNLLNYNIFGVIDQCDNAERWKETLGEKLIIINDKELENLYDKSLVNQCLRENNFCQVEWTEDDFSEFLKSNDLKDKKSEIKSKLAEFIGSNVDKNFVEKISPELRSIIFPPQTESE